MRLMRARAMRAPPSISRADALDFEPAMRAAHYVREMHAFARRSDHFR